MNRDTFVDKPWEHINFSDYADKPWELDALPDFVFRDRGINRASFIASMKSAYEQRKAAYVPVISTTPETSAKKFWTSWEKHELDKDNFHDAFDIGLLKLNALDVFDKEGNLKDRKTYSVIINIYGSNPQNDAAKALLQYWKYTFDKDNLTKSKDEIIKTRTNEVKAELKKLPLTTSWGIKGKLISVRPTHAEFEYKKKDGSVERTYFTYDFANLTAQECALKIKENYILGKYNTKTFSE